MRDYREAFVTLRRIEALATRAGLVKMVARPISAFGKVVGLTRFEQVAEGVCHLGDLSEFGLDISRQLIGATEHRSSRLVYAFWRGAEHVATLDWGDTRYHWRDVFGVPVVCDEFAESYWFASPESPSEIMRRVRSLGRSWVVRGEGEVVPDDRAVPRVIGAQTLAVVERLKAFDGPRAQLLWGPPGGGKTVAARQILVACTSMSVTLSPRAAQSGEIWDHIDDLRPDGLLIDDVDSVKDIDSLLDRLERARDYAKVIVSTANTIGALRGALLRPGRASDDEPLHYEQLDLDAVNAITPTVPTNHKTQHLLAAYLAELEARAKAGVLRGDEDVAELERRMADAGDR